MHQELHPYFLPFITITFILSYIPGSLCQDDEQFSRCSEPLRCGSVDIDYPFWGEDRPNYCGGHSSFQIKCENNIPKIAFESTTYNVIRINGESRILTLARDDLQSNICLDRPENDSFDSNTLSYVSSDQNITLYFGCRVRSGFQMQTSPYMFTCGNNIFGIYTLIGVLFDFSPVTCQNQIIVRVNQTNAEALARATASEQLLKTAIAGGFSVSWTANIDSKCLQCYRSGGRCGSNPDFTAFACHCADGTHQTNCNDGQNQGGANLFSTIPHYLLESMD